MLGNFILHIVSDKLDAFVLNDDNFKPFWDS